MHWRRKWQPTPVFLPGESQGRGSLVGCHLWGRTELDTTEVTYLTLPLPFLPDRLTCLLRNLYGGQEATVRTRHETTVWFQIRKFYPQTPLLNEHSVYFYCPYNQLAKETWGGHSPESARSPLQSVILLNKSSLYFIDEELMHLNCGVGEDS